MASAAAPVNVEAPRQEPWTGENSTSKCSAGDWEFEGPIEYTYQWVLDPGPGESVVHAVTTGAGETTWSASSANVSHVLACRVIGTVGGESSAPVYAEGPVPFPGSARVPPLVGIEVNGAVISGDVGGGLTGANTVTVSLRRDNACQYCEAPEPRERTVATSNVGAIENSTGAWTVTLPNRAVGDDRDTLFLDFSGAGPVNGSTASSGVPPDTTISLHQDQFFYDARSGLMTAMRIWPEPSGQSVKIQDSECSEEAVVCLDPVVHAPGHGGDITAAPEFFDGFGQVFTASLTPSGTNADPISASLRMADFRMEHPTVLELTKAAPMFGVYEDAGQVLRSGEGEEEGQLVETRLAPKCFAFYEEGSVGGAPASVYCLDVAPETHYELIHSHGATTSYPVETGEGQTWFRVELTNPLAVGNAVELKPGEPQWHTGTDQHDGRRLPGRSGRRQHPSRRAMRAGALADDERDDSLPPVRSARSGRIRQRSQPVRTAGLRQ